MAIYMKFGDIKGDATHDKHKEWIEIDSLQWGVGRAISTPVGGTKNREASEPSLSEVTVTKKLDASSPLLFQESTVGQQGKKCELHVVSTGSPGATYLEYVLTNTLVAGFSTSTSGDRPTESVSLNFTKFEMKVVILDEKNQPKGNMMSGYDLATTKKV